MADRTGRWWGWAVAVTVGLAGGVTVRLLQVSGVAALLAPLPLRVAIPMLSFVVVVLLAVIVFHPRLGLAPLQSNCAVAVSLVVAASGYAMNYAVILDRRAEAADKAYLWHEALRLRRLAVPLVIVGHWPLLRADDRAGYAGLLAKVAVNAHQTGDLSQAHRYAEEAVSRCRKVPRASCGTVLQLRAWLRRDYDPAAAQEDLLAAREYPDSKPEVPWLEIDLADVAMRASDPGRALAHLDEAEARAGQPVTEALTLRAQVLLRARRHAEARAALDSAKATRSRGELPVDFVGEPFELEADLLLREGRFKEAERVAGAFLMDLAPPFMWVPHRLAGYNARMGWAREGQGDTLRAMAHYLAGVAALEAERRRTPAGMRTGWLAEEAHAVPYRHLTALLAGWRGDSLPRTELREFGGTAADAALHFAEAIRARTFLEQMAANGRPVGGELSDEMRGREAALLEEGRALQGGFQRALAKGGFEGSRFQKDSTGRTVYRTRSAPETVVEAGRRLVAFEREWDAFVRELRERHPRYAAIHYPRPVAASQVPLEEDEVVLEYALAATTSNVFRLTRGRSPEAIPLGVTGDSVTALVGRYLGPLREGRASPDPSAGKELSRLLLEAPLAGVPPDRRLVIVPDGVLWTLPFEMLPAPGGAAALLGDAWRVSYAASLSILTLNRLLAAPAPPRPFFGVADPSLRGQAAAGTTAGGYALRGIHIGRSSYEFPPLPETRGEVETAARVFGTVPSPPDVLMGELATESRVRAANLGRYRVLHVATHGVANDDLAGIREPALILVGDASHDGILRASEVLDLRLGPSLVVLAACKTGLGEERAGEGVMSLARAFQQAGARTVIMSLWSVPSEATAVLFQVFYRELAAGTGTGESLRRARTAVRQLYPEPLHWAAFVLVGEER
ncbi:MAG: CHAT domain-containing protein [Gemmatimonadales bacterium]